MMKEERYSRTDEVKQNRSEEAMERRSLRMQQEGNGGYLSMKVPVGK